MDSNPFNAKVACHQLGLPWTGAVAMRKAYFGSNSALPILMDNVQCVGDESQLETCARSGYESDCGHDEDVGETMGNSGESVGDRFRPLVDKPVM